MSADSTGVVVAKLTEIPAGESLRIPAEDAGTSDDVALFHTDDGLVYAIADTCTHEEASLCDGWLEGDVVECPLHSATFCLRTGKALTPPAVTPVATYRVELRGEDIVLFVNE